MIYQSSSQFNQRNSYHLLWIN